MSDIMEKVRRIFREETWEKVCLFRGKDWDKIWDACDRIIDRIGPLLKPEPSKGREERVEEVRKIIWRTMEPQGYCHYAKLAEQIVASEPRSMQWREVSGEIDRLRAECIKQTTDFERVCAERNGLQAERDASEPQPMSREEMVKRVVQHLRKIDFSFTADALDFSSTETFGEDTHFRVEGVTLTIDALASKIPASEPSGKMMSREERVEEVRKIIFNDEQALPNGCCERLAKQIVATDRASEPQAMSREEMVEAVADEMVVEGNYPAAIALRKGERADWDANLVIDALAGKIPMSDNEARRWNEAYEGQVEHSAYLAKGINKREAEIEKLKSIIFQLRLQPPPTDEKPDITEQKEKAVSREEFDKAWCAIRSKYSSWCLEQLEGKMVEPTDEKPDRLDRICELLGKISNDEKGYEPYMRIFGSRSGAVRTGWGYYYCRFGPGDDPEQVIAMYVAGLEKSSDLRRELELMKDSTTVSTEFPALRRLAEEKLKETE